MKIKQITLVFLSLFFLACEEEGVLFHQQIKMEDNIWKSSKSLRFEFSINDTVKRYDFLFLLRTTDAYSWSNIFVFTELKTPDQNDLIKDTLEFVLADKYGNWLGENSGSVVSNNFLIDNKIKFPVKGTYTFIIHQAMREDFLREVLDVGLKIRESKKYN